MKPTVVRLAAAVLAASCAAAAGCAGGEHAGSAAGPGHTPVAGSAPAPDPQRTADLVSLSTAQAVRAADRIVVARAGTTRVVEGAPGTPFTRTRFTAVDVLKGDLPRSFVVQVIGGRLGDTTVPSVVPAFARAHRYVLFLGPDGPAGPTIFPQSVLDAQKAGAAAAVAAIRRLARRQR